jgi:hypothetical protein
MSMVDFSPLHHQEKSVLAGLILERNQLFYKRMNGQKHGAKRKDTVKIINKNMLARFKGKNLRSKLDVTAGNVLNRDNNKNCLKI